MNKHNNAPIVHIGLGKTGTTSLQRLVFPRLSEFHSGIRYNDPCLIRLLKRICLTPSNAAENSFKKNIREGNHFISNEGLVDWNPRRWEYAAERNLNLFGREATVLISVRETHDYLRSIYQQKVHEGNVRCATEFFMSSKSYDLVSSCLAPAILSRFDVDSFDLEKLYELYSTRFSKVIVIPASELQKLDFLGHVFGLNQSQISYLRSQLHNGPRRNRAYSKLAMDLTLYRERILQSFGLATRGSDVLRIKKLERALLDELKEDYSTGITCEASTFEVSGGLGIGSDASKFPLWRYFIQNVFDRVVPYKKFQLPDGVYRNRELENKNSDFVSKFLS